MPDTQYTDPRLVPLYDLQNGWSADDDLFRAVVGHRGPCRVLDLGCGTGRLSVVLAADGHTVTGVDPAAPALAAAHAKPGAQAVTWVQGTSADLPPAAFDVAIMTSHVAQVFGTDDAWTAVLDDVARALLPGGRIAFDSRNPVAAAWERWAGDHRDRIDTAAGEVESWRTVDSVIGDLVTITESFAFPDGDVVTSRSVLRFRTEEQLRGSLTAAGFVVDTVHGGWHGEPVGAGVGELVVQAHLPV